MLDRQRREHRVFQALLQMIPGLEDRLMGGSESDVMGIAESVCVYNCDRGALVGSQSQMI